MLDMLKRLEKYLISKKKYSPEENWIQTTKFYFSGVILKILENFFLKECCAE